MFVLLYWAVFKNVYTSSELWCPDASLSCFALSCFLRPRFPSSSSDFASSFDTSCSLRGHHETCKWTNNEILSQNKTTIVFAHFCTKSVAYIFMKRTRVRSSTTSNIPTCSMCIWDYNKDNSFILTALRLARCHTTTLCNISML